MIVASVFLNVMIMKMRFDELFKTSRFIITEGAILERVKRFKGVELDPYINHAGLIYDAPSTLKMLYIQYIDIAKRRNLPVMLMTPTRKVNYETLAKSKFSTRDIFNDSFEFLSATKKAYNGFSDNIYIGALLGCRGDAYRADEPLIRSEAFQFHRIQVRQFSQTGIDYFFAGIMPEIGEATGMAEAIAETGIPYIISFMIRNDGKLIDGTSISEAISIIDNEVYPQPLCYMANCIHPFNLRLALTNGLNYASPQLRRFKGIQANSSRLSPEELNNSCALFREDYNEIIKEMKLLQTEFDFKIFGGCCGTDDRFLDKLALMLRDNECITRRFRL